MLIVVWLRYKTFIKNLFWFMIIIYQIVYKGYLFLFIILSNVRFTVRNINLGNLLSSNFLNISFQIILSTINNKTKHQLMNLTDMKWNYLADHWHNIAHHVFVLYIIIIYLTKEVFLFTDDNNHRFPTSSLLGLLNCYSNVLVWAQHFKGNVIQCNNDRG